MPDGILDSRNHIDTDKFPRLRTLQVKTPSSFVRRGPRPSAPAETEILHGTLFHLHQRDPNQGRGWVWGQAECQLPGISYPGYVGWCRLKDLRDPPGKPTHKISSVAAPVFSKPDIKSRVTGSLPLCAVINAVRKNEFLEIDTGFIHQNHVMEIGEVLAADWVNAAESLLGRPYIWGGVSAEGLDCSGLVQTALRASGSDAPRDSDQQASLGTAIAITPDNSGLKRGDLVFWKGHVGIMSSPARLLHANAWHMKVASEPLETAVKRIEKLAGPVTAIRRL